MAGRLFGGRVPLRSRALRTVGALVAIAAAIAISPAPARCFPWDIDMFRGPAVQPYAEAPRVSPAGILPVRGGQPPMKLEQMTVHLHNPLAATPGNLAAGKQEFTTFCAPCHGPKANGKGPVARSGILDFPPSDLVAGASKDLPDGYIYGVIRNGLLAMPSYAEELPMRQRWQVVMYVRSLQQAATAKSTAAPKTASAAK
ncbi:MAG: c-type cytochrome [Candidatus Binataceae bacterium]